MKVVLLLACTCAVFTSKRVSCAAIEAPLDIITLDDLSEDERKTLEYLDEQYLRSKRSGGDPISLLKATLGQGIKSKLGAIARGSASASSHFSSGSSGDGHSYHHSYDFPKTYPSKHLDFWTLKKSILNTLLQAVKAIKGGVIALQGQLIKGSGYLVSAKGNFIKSKGEAITNLGKNIAASAVLVPPHGHISHGHEGYEHPHISSYGHTGGEYTAPSAPGPEYEIPDHHHSIPHHHEDKPSEPESSGILILKKIPPHNDEHTSYHAEESKVPHFKHIAPSGPSFGTIIGKFFKASTSLQPGEPAPFGESSFHSDDYHHEPSHDDIHYGPPHIDESHSDITHEPHDYVHEPPHHIHESLHKPSHHVKESFHETHHEEPPHEEPSHEGPSHSSSIEIGPTSSHNYDQPPQTHEYSSDIHPPSTSYGSPFQDAPRYLDYDGHTSESKKSHKSENPVKPNLQPTSVASSSPVSSKDLVQDSYGKPIGFNKINKPYASPSSASLNNMKFGNIYPNVVTDLRFLSPPDPSESTFPSYNSFLTPSLYNKNSAKTNSRNKIKRPSFPKQQPFQVIKSIGYELGPKGPKRL